MEMEKELLDLIRTVNLPSVFIMDYTELSVCIRAIRVCYDSFHKSDNAGERDLALIQKVGNQYKHSSVLEHLTYNFEICGISRAVLQKIARHRIASYSVKSTQYTLNEFKNIPLPSDIDHFCINLLSKYIVLLETEEGINSQIVQLKLMQTHLQKHGINASKYLLPESYKTNLVMSINARSLQNILSLRTPRNAHFPEVRILAYMLYQNIPVSHRFIFAEFIHNEDELKELVKYQDK